MDMGALDLFFASICIKGLRGIGLALHSDDYSF
jgi:hypothetical protein